MHAGSRVLAPGLLQGLSESRGNAEAMKGRGAENPNPMPSLPQAYLGVRLSVWNYNALVAAWEPVLEPWDVIAKLDLNSSTTVRALAPHTSVSHPIKPTHGTTALWPGHLV